MSINQKGVSHYGKLMAHIGHACICIIVGCNTTVSWEENITDTPIAGNITPSGYKHSVTVMAGYTISTYVEENIINVTIQA